MIAPDVHTIKKKNPLANPKKHTIKKKNPSRITYYQEKKSLGKTYYQEKKSSNDQGMGKLHYRDQWEGWKTSMGGMGKPHYPKRGIKVIQTIPM